MQRSLIIGLISALILVIFALLNSDPVKLDFVIGKPVEGTPLSLILLITLIIGVFVGLLFSYPSFKKFKKVISENKSEITKLYNILDEYKKESGLNKKNEEAKKEESKADEK